MGALRRLTLISAAGVGAALLLAASSPLWGQSHHHHPPQDAEVHEKFYSTWMRPDNPNVSCCDKKDCYPTAARHRNGRWEAQRREDGKWLIVPEQKIERIRDNPDGRAHLCAPPPEGESYHENGVICFSIGAGT